MTRPEILHKGDGLGRGVRPQKTQRHQLETQALLDTLREISSHLDLDEVLRAIVDRARALMGSESASLGLKVENQDEIEMRAEMGLSALIRLRLGEGLIGLVAQERKPVFVADYLADQRLVHTVDESVRRAGVRAALGVPLMLDDKVIGVLTVANRCPTVFTADDAALLMSLASSAAIAIENARLFQSERDQVLQLTELNAQVRAQHTLLKKAVAIHDHLTEMVLEDRGIEAIAVTLAGLVDNPVVVEDRFFTLVTCAAKGVGTAAQAEEDVACWGTPRQAIENAWMREQVKLLAKERRPIHLPARPDLDLHVSRIMAPIIAGEDVLGYLSVPESNRQLEEFDLLAMEHSATIFALEMMKQRIAFDVERQIKGDFLDDLISGTYQNPKSILDRAAYLGYDLSRPQQLLIVEADDFTQIVKQCKGEEKQLLLFKKRLYQVISSALQRKGIRCLMARKSDSILIVLPAVVEFQGIRWETNQIAELFQTEIARALPGTTVSVGVGCVCAEFADFPRFYEEARKALDIARSFGDRNRIVNLDGLGAYWLLLQVQDKNALCKFVQRTLGLLLDYDAKHNSQLVPTLDAFLQNNCNIQNTAQALFVHVNTLTYRLKRIQEVGRLDLGNAEHRFNAQLALKTIRATAAS